MEEEGKGKRKRKEKRGRGEGRGEREKKSTAPTKDVPPLKKDGKNGCVFYFRKLYSPLVQDIPGHISKD